MDKISKIFFINGKMLDINHEHSITFYDRNAQYNWFMERCVYTMEDCSFVRKERSILLNLNINNTKNINYCITLNYFQNKPTYEYFFIVNKEYVNDHLTKCYLKLDVIQTYIFDINFNYSKSLIDRRHCDRYVSNGTTINKDYLCTEEGLETGELLIKDARTVYDYQNKGSYIITSSTKLGKGAYTNPTPTPEPPSGGSTGGGVANAELWRSGYISENGFVAIKSWEGFCSTAVNIGDGTNTIGYGTTSVYDPTHYNQLAPRCTEKQASEVYAHALDTIYAKQVLDRMKSSGMDLSKVKQCEFDAWVSFCYNHGSFYDHEIWDLYVAGGDRNTIANKWKTTVIMAGSQFEQGLRNRRTGEANMFLGIYPAPSILDNSTYKKVTDNGGKGYVPDRYIVHQSTSGSNSLGQKLVNSAKKLIGKPYVWGGNYPPLGGSNGTDCSGLMQWAYNDNGLKITRTTYTQIKEGKEVGKDELQLGDLVFVHFSSPGVPEHVFMFSGKNSAGQLMCVEAPHTGLNIRERVFTWDNTTRARRLI